LLVLAALTATWTFVPGPLLAATWHVPGDFSTIQGAIQLAQYGDSVVVAPGNYPENLTMRSGVLVRGTGGAEATVVDGRYLGPVVLCNNALDFTLEDLTLRRGYMAAYPGGAGVAMDHARGLVARCLVIDNLAGRDGGGISVVDSRATIVGCTFRNNSAAAASALDGGGIFCYRSEIVVEDTQIIDNLAQEGGGLAIVLDSSAAIRRCVIARNEALGPGPAGGAIAVASSAVEITSSTMVENRTPLTGASVALISGSGSFTRSIVARAAGYGLLWGAPFSVLCNDVWGSGGLNYAGPPPDPSNQSADPLFCDLAHLDLRLDQSSPCAPPQSPPGCGLIGAFGVGCGPIAVEPASWGQIKAHFAAPAK
jgi:hypothetical protein